MSMASAGSWLTGVLTCAAQNAQSGICPGHQIDHIAVAHEVVVARAQEGEVLVFQPLQKINALLAVDHGADRLDSVRSLLSRASMGAPVVDDRTHITQHLAQLSRQCLSVRIIQNAVAFDEDEGFHPDAVTVERWSRNPP
jgi:hypothetical protein